MKLKLNKAFFLFLFGCIPTRLFAMLIAKYGSPIILKILGGIYMIFGIGIFLMYFMAPIKNETMAFLGNDVWWHDIRPLFGILWICFAILALTGYKNIAWKILFIEVMFGLFMFLSHHKSYYI